MRLAEAPGARLGGLAEIAALCDRVRAGLERARPRRAPDTEV
jgi:hypothetical protein